MSERDGRHLPPQRGISIIVKVTGRSLNSLTTFISNSAQGLIELPGDASLQKVSLMLTRFKCEHWPPGSQRALAADIRLLIIERRRYLESLEDQILDSSEQTDALPPNPEGHFYSAQGNLLLSA